jgi:hypothetical protein
METMELSDAQNVPSMPRDHPRRTRVPVADRLKIVTLARAGKRVSEIAAELHRPYTTIRLQLARAGLPTAPQYYFEIPVEMESEICARLRNRESQRRIAALFSIGVKRIGRIAKRHNIRRLKRESYHLTPEMRRQVAMARGSAPAVARRFRVNASTVLRARKKYPK